MRRIRVAVVSVLFMLALASSAALAAPRMVRVSQAPPKKKHGQPDNPNGFGTVVSQKASHYHDVGEHSRDPERDGPGPRQGVGNVSRNDGAKGDHPGDHGGFVGGLDDQVGADPDGVTDASGDPGRPR